MSHQLTTDFNGDRVFLSRWTCSNSWYCLLFMWTCRVIPWIWATRDNWPIRSEFHGTFRDTTGHFIKWNDLRILDRIVVLQINISYFRWINCLFVWLLSKNENSDPKSLIPMSPWAHDMFFSWVVLSVAAPLAQGTVLGITLNMYVCNNPANLKVSCSFNMILAEYSCKIGCILL